MINRLYIGILVIFLITQCSNVKKTEEKRSNSNAFADKVELSDLEGNKVDLFEQRGKTIILNIWATWCKPCIEEFPSMQALQATLDPTKYVMLFASSEDLNRIEKFKLKNGFDLNFIQLNTSPESLGIFSLPITFIISREGELLLTQNGSKDWSSNESIEALKKISI